MDTNTDQEDGSSSDLDISNDINGCLKSLDDDIDGPKQQQQPPPAATTAASSDNENDGSTSSSSSSSSSSSESSSSSSSKSSKTSSSHKKSSSKVKEKAALASTTMNIVATTDRVLYPARFHKKQQPPPPPPPLAIDRPSSSSHKPQHRSRSRSRGPRSVRESGYRTDGSVTSDIKRRKSRAPSAPRSTATPIDIDLDLNVLQLSAEPSSSSVKLTRKNVNLMARKNDTNNNNNNNGSAISSSKIRPMSMNLELNRRLLEHKMNLNGRSIPFSAASCKLGFGLKSSQSFQELTATSKVMAPSWTADEKNTPKPVKYAKSLSRIVMKSRRPSVASRAGSVRSATSTISRMRRAPTPATIKNNEYVMAQVVEVTAALAKCTISSSKTFKNSKSHHHHHNKNTHNNVSKKKKTASKRRNKKINDNDNDDTVPAAEDHKLPLKKRHYLITEEKASSVKRKRTKKSAPPGIFEPTTTTTNEQQQLENNKKPSFDVFDIMCPIVTTTTTTSSSISATTTVKPKSVVDNILTKMEPTVNKRKRRRANRTGFPTPKRPKKKVVNDNASDTSSNVIKKQRRRKKAVVKDDDDDVQMLTARQLLLKQQKELELNKEVQQETTRNVRGRAKSVCHIPDSKPEISLPPVKRKRRQTIFIDHTTEDVHHPPPHKLKKLSSPLPEIRIERIDEKSTTNVKKKRRQTVHLDNPPPLPSLPAPPLPNNNNNNNKKLARHESKKISSSSSDISKSSSSSSSTSESTSVKLIPKNYYNGDTQKKAFVPSLKGTKCRCTPNPCGESCLNRSMFIECDVSLCGKNCTNTVIQTGGLLNKDVEKFQTEQKGYGVRTKKNITKKTLILEYTGEVLFKEAFRQRMQTIYKNDQHHYCLELSNGLVLDGHRMGSLCRFVNHSCKPNCGMAKIYVDGLPRMILQAEEDIKAGTELTYDYKFDNFEDMTPQQCYCGADTCRGTLSAAIKTPRRMSMSYKDGEIVKKVGRKSKSSSSPKSISCFLMRNLRRVEKYHPGLMAYYQNMKNRLEDDPKVGFSFVSKTHENSPPSSDNHSEPATKTDEEQQKPDEESGEEKNEPEVPVIVNQPLSEQSQVLWQICERLDSTHAAQIKQVSIPLAPATGHSNHDRISLPVSFDDIKQNVQMGIYDLNPLLFHYNMKIMLDNVVKFWGVNCEQFHTMIDIRDAYKTIRTEMTDEIRRIWEDEFLVNAMMDKIIRKPAKNRKKVIEKNDDEDIVNCHCGRYLEEGLMIQCQKCLTWQHVECAGQDGKTENYHCIKCEPRTVDMDIIKKDETTADGHQCYLTLMRGDLQIRVGDAVYVLRDIPIDSSKTDGPRHTYETIEKVNYSECDIVRVETLYKDEKGEPRVLGHHYLRPNEVYHEPSRKFYTNELMRTSIFESIPINLVIDTCWVLDPNTYFKGRPINSIEQHVYICEYKVDKQARVFSVIKKSSRQPISTKPYAFYKFEELLRQRRNHLPHDIDHVIPKKIKKEMQQQQQLQSKKDMKVNNENHVDLPILSLSKDIIQHRPAPKKIFTRKQKIDNLEKCIGKIKSPKDLMKNSKDTTTNSKINSKLHNNNEIKADKSDANVKKNAKAKKKEEQPEVKEKKKRGRRGKTKI